MKKHATTVLMVALAAAIGLWVWLDRDHATTGERKQRENNVFQVWRKEELGEVSIVHEGETIVLVREGGTWRMTSPRKERADPAAVDRLLTTLEFATVARRASDATTLGLDAPRASVAVRMGSFVVKAALGGASPRPEGSSYLRVDDGAPVVVSKELAEALLASSDVYRDRSVVPYLATELARFQVAHAEGGYALARLDERSFTIEGAKVLAARSAVERMWNALAEMRAEAFPKDADVDRLTARPVLTLTLTPKDGRPVAEILVGEACPEHPNDVVVLRKTPTRIAACAPKDIVGALNVKGTAFIEQHPFTWHDDEVEEVRLEWLDGADAGAAPKALELARKGTTFHERFPTDRDLPAAESDAASDLLTRILGAEASAVTSGGGSAFTPIARARLHAGERDEVVEVGAIDARGHAVLRRALDDARLDASPAFVRALLPRETSLRARVVVEGEARRATRVVLRCGVDQELVDRGEGFRFVSPTGFEADSGIVQLVDAVLRGRVGPWVSDVDDGTFGFGRDSCHVVIAFEDEKAPLTLWFGAEGEGGVYARVDTRSGVFVAPPSLRELAGRIYVSRGSLRVESARIERVRATFEGKPVVREATALRDAVATLHADRVVALGTKAQGGAPDLILEVALGEGGPPRRIACRTGGPGGAGEALCTVTGVDATFGLAATRLAPLLPIARDGGAR